MKGAKLMTIDVEVWSEFQKQYPNQASSFCEDAMRKRLELEDLSGVEKVDRELLDIKEKKTQKDLDDLNSQMNFIKGQRDRMNKEVSDAELKRLEDEKLKAEQLRKCPACDNLFTQSDKTINLDGIIYCYACFMTDHPVVVAAMKADKKRRREQENIINDLRTETSED